MNSKTKSLIQDYKKIQTLEQEYYKLCKKYDSLANFESAPSRWKSNTI